MHQVIWLVLVKLKCPIKLEHEITSYGAEASGGEGGGLGE